MSADGRIRGDYDDTEYYRHEAEYYSNTPLDNVLNDYFTTYSNCNTLHKRH